jgi:hypothetical protein
VTVSVEASEQELTGLIAAAVEKVPAAAILRSVRLRDSEVRATVDAPGVGNIDFSLRLVVKEPG